MEEKYSCERERERAIKDKLTNISAHMSVKLLTPSRNQYKCTLLCFFFFFNFLFLPQQICPEDQACQTMLWKPAITIKLHVNQYVSINEDCDSSKKIQII